VSQGEYNLIINRKTELENEGKDDKDVAKIIKREWKDKELTVPTPSQIDKYIPKILKGEIKPKVLSAGVSKKVYVFIFI